MEFDVKAIPLTRIVLGDTGVAKSLCDTCLNPDCTNPIRTKQVSVMGVPIKMRLYCTVETSLMVVECKDGYTPPIGPQQ